MPCRCVLVIGTSGVAGPVPVTTWSSQAAQSLRKSQPTCMCCCFPLGPLICILRLKERRPGDRALGIQHPEDDSREVSRKIWPDHRSKRVQGSLKLISVNTLFHPPLKISPYSLVVFSHCSRHTAGQSGAPSPPVCMRPARECRCFPSSLHGCPACGWEFSWAAAD